MRINAYVLEPSTDNYFSACLRSVDMKLSHASPAVFRLGLTRTWFTAPILNLDPYRTATWARSCKLPYKRISPWQALVCMGTHEHTQTRAIQRWSYTEITFHGSHWYTRINIVIKFIMYEYLYVSRSSYDLLFHIGCECILFVVLISLVSFYSIRVA